MDKKYFIYLDLDGVFANLEKKLSEIYNKSSHLLTKEEWDESLKSYTQPYSKINLFLDLDLMNWAKEFYSLMLQLNKRNDIEIRFLTSISSNKTNKRRVIAEKELWVIKNLGDDFPIIYSDSWTTKFKTISKNNKSSNKTENVHILLDDFINQKEVWESNGGVFIHHLGDLKESYHKLIELI